MGGAAREPQTRWEYDWTWARESDDKEAGRQDRARIRALLDERSKAGWELVNANAVWLTTVDIGAFGGGSSGTLRHYFYFRRRLLH